MSVFGAVSDTFGKAKGALKRGVNLTKDAAAEITDTAAGIAPNNTDVTDISDFGNYLDTKYGYFEIGHVDVIRNYNWGMTKSSQLRLNEVPSIELIEFQPSNGPVMESVLYAFRSGGEAVQSALTNIAVKLAEGKAVGSELVGVTGIQQAITNEAIRPKLEDNRRNAYVDMYTGMSTGNVYSFPYFSTYNHSMSTSWEAQDGLASKILGEDLTNIFKGAHSVTSNAYVGMTKRQQFKGVSDVSFETSFQLFNTLSNEVDTNKTILKNYKLIYALLFNNMPDKLSISTLRPPVIYSMSIPGVRTSPAVYISTLVIENLGQVNKVPLTINGNQVYVNVPDAWNVQMVITEMMPESRNIFNGVIDANNKVVVIDDIRGTT